MVKYCFISPTTSDSCQLEPTMIKSSTRTAMNTLRARSTKRVGCASDRVKPSLDVSTAAKCSWNIREASLKPLKARLKHQTVSFCSWRPSGGSTYTGSPSGMGVFMKATLMSPSKMVRSFDTAIAHNTLVASSPGV